MVAVSAFGTSEPSKLMNDSAFGATGLWKIVNVSASGTSEPARIKNVSAFDENARLLPYTYVDVTF